MSNKSIVVTAVVTGILVIGGGALVYNNTRGNDNTVEKVATSSKSVETEPMPKDDVTNNDTAMSKSGTYVTLADYNAEPSKYADSNKVYFFHAGWCPICQAIDKEINEDTSKIPAGVTIIKTDFDSSTELRQKYGVTTQYTFVQVDNNGNETDQWSASNLTKAIAGIKS